MKMTQIYARAYAGTLTLEDIRKAHTERLDQQVDMLVGKNKNNFNGTIFKRLDRELNILCNYASESFSTILMRI